MLFTGEEPIILQTKLHKAHWKIRNITIVLCLSLLLLNEGVLNCIS